MTRPLIAVAAALAVTLAAAAPAAAATPLRSEAQAEQYLLFQRESITWAGCAGRGRSSRDRYRSFVCVTRDERDGGRGWLLQTRPHGWAARPLR